MPAGHLKSDPRSGRQHMVNLPHPFFCTFPLMCTFRSLRPESYKIPLKWLWKFFLRIESFIIDQIFSLNHFHEKEDSGNHILALRSESIFHLHILCATFNGFAVSFRLIGNCVEESPYWFCLVKIKQYPIMPCGTD